MKRAWPYALALAVVVTGCYLALTPLLRSLSPAPTTSASPLSQSSAVVTVGKTKVAFVSPSKTPSQFVSNLATKKKTTKKKAKKAAAGNTAPITSTPSQSSTGNTGFAGNASSSSTPSSSSGSSTPTKKAPAQTASKKSTAPVGGIIDQSQADNGFAGPSGSGAVTGGQTQTPGS